MADKRDESGQLDGSEGNVVGVGYGDGCARQSVGKPSRKMGKETVLIEWLMQKQCIWKQEWMDIKLNKI